ncbi:phosphoadenosine phosphosulfate reductase family protein [Paenibacillus elgii]
MEDWRSKATASLAAILQAYTDDSRPGTWALSYSGGKDSSVTAAITFEALLALKPAQRKRKIYLTSAQTRLDFTTDHVKQLELQRQRKIIQAFNLPIEIVEVEADNENTFLFLVLGLGYVLPEARTNRWCTERLKIEPQKRFIESAKPQLRILGVRSSESTTRAESIKSFQIDKYFGDNGTFMPIVDFTLEDVWSYIAIKRAPWGDLQDVANLYKDATGECGLRGRKAGKGEKVDDPCGARFGCIICPVVTIDKSSRELAKKYPWFQPYVRLRDVMIDMYKQEENRAGYMRDGQKLYFGEGNFNIRARMRLFDLFMEAQAENEYLATKHGGEPQPLFFSEELIERIRKQWEMDAEQAPWLIDAGEIGQFFDQRPAGMRGKYDKIPYHQITWNHRTGLPTG